MKCKVVSIQYSVISDQCWVVQNLEVLLPEC